VRIFDEALARYLAGTVDKLTILSMSQLAAPVFADAALKLLGEAGAAPARPVSGHHHRARRLAPDRVLLGALVGLALIVIPATLYFAIALDLRLIDALYFVWTTVMTVGYGDISLSKASDGSKLVGMLLMLAGGAFMATLFAFLTGWVVTRRIEVLAGRVRIRGDGHILVAGAGNLGFRVARRLAAEGRRVVVMERNGSTHNVAVLRAEGLHVVVADAANDDVLDLAGVDQAGAVLALTDSDAVNLEIALLVRARGGRAKVVMRGNSPELCAHVSHRGDGIALSPIGIATASFTDVILGVKAA